MMQLSGLSGKRICAAVSGGADSMALLHMLKAREAECGFFLSAVNCEHGIRGEDSLSDTRFVEEMCRLWKIPLFLFSADCLSEAKREKVSVETAARNFRLRCFQSLLDEDKADYIATAHHADDNAETVLFRLCRGTSLSGARGMEKVRGRFLKPLLDMSKAEICAYVSRNEIPFREDKTNFETDATRNKLRLDILPALENAIPGAARNLSRFASLAAEDDALLCEMSAHLLREVQPKSAEDTGLRVKISPKAPLMKRACLSALKKSGVEKDYTSAALEGVYGLGALQTGSQVSLPGGIIAKREYDFIAFYRARKTPPAPVGEEKNFCEGIFETERYVVCVSDSPPRTEDMCGKPLRLDADALPKDAVFRFRRAGDAFEKFGGGTKTLKKYFIDKKIPQALRDELPLIAAEKSGEVYVVCGVEIADCVKVSDSAGRTLYITLRKKKPEDSP